MSVGPVIDRLDARLFEIPTDGAETDGTLRWDHTTVLVVCAEAAGRRGLGYTYSNRAAATVVSEILRHRVIGAELAPAARWSEMVAALRNVGRTGVGSMALAAVDICLWDLHARVLGVSLARLLGQVHEEVPIYGSGGFTSYTIAGLREQLAGWVDSGIGRVKMKVARHPARDLARVHAAREAIGAAQLYVDANGGYGRREALAMARAFADEGVTWLEEPVPADDVDGLRFVRDHAPPAMEITAGEYAEVPSDFRRFLEAGAVDVIQVDATRCGITGYMHAIALAQAWHTEVSTHCAPSVHAQLASATPGLRHVEYFHDHVRAEGILFDGVLEPKDGALRVDSARAGMGLSLRGADARHYELAA